MLKKEKGEEKKMEKYLSKGLASLAILIIVLGALAAVPLPTKASSTVQIYIDPPNYIFDTSTATIGTKFNVTVWAKDPTASWKAMMIQIYMVWNQEYINVTRFWGEVTGDWTYTVWPNDNLGGRYWDPEYIFYAKPGGGIGNPYFYNLAPNLAAVKVADVLTAEVTVPAGVRKKLAQFEFTIIKVPSKGETFESVLNINNADTFIYDAVGPIDVTKTDGLYRITWVQPPPAIMDIVRADGLPWPKRYYNWENAVGQTFAAKVYIKVDPAWGLTNATFTLNYASTPQLIDIVDISDIQIDPFWGTSSITFGTYAVTIFVGDPAGPVGPDALVGTITFTVIYQGSYPAVDQADITFSDVTLYNHVSTIPTGTHGKGKVIVEGFLALPLAWMEVYPDYLKFGPENVVGEEFTVAVKINELHFAWYVVAIQFAFTYDYEYLEVVNVTEGPFLKNPRWNWYGTYFVWNSYIWPDVYIAVGDILLPNPEGEWDQTEFPNTLDPTIDNTFAYITFKIKKQPTTLDPDRVILTLAATGLGGECFIDKDGHYVPYAPDKFEDGTVVILSSAYYGRFIDVFGGASNAGYGPFPDPWPAPYGGQGLNKPMDLVIPQSEVALYALVLYNMWPVQSKDVCFEVEGPYEHVNGQFIPKDSWMLLLKETARTNGSGIAMITFAMPWFCEDPESLLGVWKVTATVNIRDVIVTDTLYFYYDYLVHIWKVTTDKAPPEGYKHCEDVYITVEYGSRAMQKYPALFSIMIKDDLNVPIGIIVHETKVGGAEFCTFANGTFTRKIHVPKWAFSGTGYIYVNCFDKNPTTGGFAWCPQYPVVRIKILPQE